MGSAQSVHNYQPLPDDEVELIDFNVSSNQIEEALLPEKVEPIVSFSLCDQYREWIRKRKEREEEKQRKIEQDLMISKMMKELVAIAKTALIDVIPSPIPDDKVKEVLDKYGNIGYSKEVYNIVDIEPIDNEWKFSVDKEVNELVMVVTKCVKNSTISSYKVTLKKGEGFLLNKNDNERANIYNSELTHLVFLVTSAGISTLDVYEGDNHSYRRRLRFDDGRYSPYRRRHRGGGGGGGGGGGNGFTGMTAFGGMTGGFGGGFGGGGFGGGGGCGGF
jgi:hypothetical protein